MGTVVLEKARELFFTYGLKSISMDDLARQSGVSKKTIYQAVADKQELVGRVVEELVQCHTDAIKASSQQAENAVAELIGWTCLPFDTLASINVNFFYELEKFFPAEWKMLLEHRDKIILPAIIKNLKRGIAEGIYREDLDIALIASIRLQQISTALNPVGFSDKRIDARKLMNDLTTFYLHGITNTKGKRLINKYLNLNDENRTIQ